ncbi:MAG: hypothetical protein IT305_14665 [Chloroflexi bacterium]|nr:hypothetical protein [Chloroflexota bacterium]
MNDVPEPSGTCAICGGPLPAPDLEAVASDIDQALSLEFGRMISRLAWAGRPPDGVLDGLFGFLPFVKVKRQIWERGQALWVERMSAAMAIPCPDCQARSSVPDESATAGFMPTAAMLPADTPTTAFGGRSASDSVPAPTAPAVPSLDDERTQAISDHGREDEHESRTMIMPALSATRTGPQLIAVSGPVRGHSFGLTRDVTTIGQSIACPVSIDDPSIAAEQARVVRTASGWAVEGCAGGAVAVNDEPIAGSRPLRSGDTLTIGSARLRFETGR